MYREARVMDVTCKSLRSIRHRVLVPHSVPGLVTNRVLTMSYLEGVPLTKLDRHVMGIPEFKRKAAFRTVGHLFVSNETCCDRSTFVGF